MQQHIKKNMILTSMGLPCMSGATCLLFACYIGKQCAHVTFDLYDTF